VFYARVVGSVWSTVKWPGLEGLKLLAVRPYALSDLLPAAGAAGGATAGAPGAPSCSDTVVVADVLDAGVGDDVIVAYGHAARVAIAGSLPVGQPPTTPIDAAVVAIVDRVNLDPAAAAGRSE
jgi:microcompartment protein CcmK/EutM